MKASISIHPGLPVEPDNAGLFISRGMGMHPDRIIDSFELIFVRSGTLSISENEVDLSTPAGETLVLWPGRRHRGTETYRKGLQYYWIHFRLRNDKPPRASSPVVIPQRATPARPDRLAELYHRFLDDQESDRLTPTTASLLVQLMLCEVATSARANPTSASAVLAARAEAHILERLQEPLSASDVANALDMNPDYLTRAFKIARGQTITEFIHRARLREARAMLRDSAVSVKQIARRLGYGEATYLRRLFRRYEGMSPNAYRRLHAKVHVNVR